MSSQTESQGSAVCLETQRVVVTDISMPFTSMVWFMVKWAIASIPALLMLALLAGVVAIAFGVLGGILSALH